VGAARPTTGHFFRINMRSHHLSCLGMAHPEDEKQKVHDMTVIKRSTAGQLRYGSPPLPTRHRYLDQQVYQSCDQ
jgi:hypothetical protein